MRICKVFTWDAAHQLVLPYESKCKNMHGHTYKVEIEVQGDPDEHGIVMDFSELKQRVEAVSFDHQVLQDIACPNCANLIAEGWLPSKSTNPTAEHLVLYLKLKLVEQWRPGDPLIRRIRIWETPTSWAEEVWDLKMEALMAIIKQDNDKLSKMKKSLEESVGTLLKISKKVER